MCIGDKVLVLPSFVIVEASPDGRPSKKKPLWGEIIYIHPKARLYVAEFRFPFGTLRESFRVEEIIKIQCV